MKISVRIYAVKRIEKRSNCSLHWQFMYSQCLFSFSFGLFLKNQTGTKQIRNVMYMLQPGNNCLNESLKLRVTFLSAMYEIPR